MAYMNYDSSRSGTCLHHGWDGYAGPSCYLYRRVQQEMSKYEGLEYVKSDLVKSKGIIYVKFRLASSALKAKEDIEHNNYMVRLCSLLYTYD